MSYEPYAYKKIQTPVNNFQTKGQTEFVDNRELHTLQRKQISVIQRAAILLLNPLEITDNVRKRDLIQATVRINSGNPIFGTLVNKTGKDYGLFPILGSNTLIENQDNIDILGHSYLAHSQHCPGALDVTTLAQLIQDLPFSNAASWNGMVRIYSCQTGKRGPGTQDYILDLLTEIRSNQLPNALKVSGSTKNVHHVPVPGVSPITPGTLRMAIAGQANPVENLNDTSPINTQRIRGYENVQIPANVKFDAASLSINHCIKGYQKITNERLLLENKATQVQTLHNHDISQILHQFRKIKSSEYYTAIEDAFTIITNSNSQPSPIALLFYTLDELNTIYSSIKTIKKQLIRMNTRLDTLMQNVPQAPAVGLPPLRVTPQHTPALRFQPTGIIRRSVLPLIPNTRPRFFH